MTSSRWLGVSPRHRSASCGDGGGSNSPSKALDWTASTSVVGDFFLEVPSARRRAPGPSRSAYLDPLTDRSADRTFAFVALPGPRRGDREDAHCLGSESVRSVAIYMAA